MASADPGAPDPQAVADAVSRRAARLAPTTMLTSPLGVLFVVLAVWGDARVSHIIIWVVLFAVSFVLHYLTSVHTARVMAESPTAVPGTVNLVGRITAGLAWGMAAPILAPDSADTELRLKVLMVLAVVGVSGGIVTAGGARNVAHFVCSVAAPMLVMFSVDGGSLTALAVPGLVVACALTVWYGSVWNTSVFEATEAQLRSADLAARLAAQVQISNEAAERYRELHVVMSEMARRDDLTGMLNRRGFFDEFQHVDEMARTWQVALLDLDHFKVINDAFGHAVGDEALRHVARVLLDTVPTRSIVGRLGGEEFALVMPDATVDEMMMVIEQIRRHLDRSPAPGGHALTVSVGIAAGGRGLPWGSTIDHALSRADAAMYQAKARGRDTVVLDGMTA